VINTDVAINTEVVSITGAREITRVKIISSVQDLQNPYSARSVEVYLPFRETLGRKADEDLRR
jgi:hypothetical protein